MEDYYGAEGNSRLGIPKRAVLADLSRNGHWCIPQPRTENQLQVVTYITTIELQQIEDFYEWELNGKVSATYSTGEVYHSLRTASPQVSWASVVWFPGNIPRQAFLTWLFVLDRRPTRDRIASWGLQVSPNCLVCSTGIESRDHFFFECDFSFSIWSAIAYRCRFPPRRNWNQTLLAMESLGVCKRVKRLTLLAWQATIYAAWAEKNSRLHRNSFRSANLITSSVERQITNKISSLRPTNPVAASALKQTWFSTS